MQQVHSRIKFVWHCASSRFPFVRTYFLRPSQDHKSHRSPLAQSRLILLSLSRYRPFRFKASILPFQLLNQTVLSTFSNVIPSSLSLSTILPISHAYQTSLHSRSIYAPSAPPNLHFRPHLPQDPHPSHRTRDLLRHFSHHRGAGALLSRCPWIGKRLSEVQRKRKLELSRPGEGFCEFLDRRKWPS